jgi:hypothetical protein
MKILVSLIFLFTATTATALNSDVYVAFFVNGRATAVNNGIVTGFDASWRFLDNFETGFSLSGLTGLKPEKKIHGAGIPDSDTAQPKVEFNRIGGFIGGRFKLTSMFELAPRIYAGYGRVYLSSTYDFAPESKPAYLESTITGIIFSPEITINLALKNYYRVGLTLGYSLYPDGEITDNKFGINETSADFNSFYAGFRLEIGSL